MIVSISLALLAAMRLADILHNLMLLTLVEKRAPSSTPRSIVLLFNNYLSVILIYATLFLVLPRICGQPLFFVAGTSAELTSGQSFFFSAITASTIGYGDITPSLAANASSIIIRCTIILESFTILVITLIEMPRLIAYLIKETLMKAGSSSSSSDNMG